MTLTTWIDAAADAALATAAIWVSFTALRGWRKEVASRRPANADQRDTLESDAKLLYVSASLQKPLILMLVFAGSLTKLVLTLCSLGPHSQAG
jgi:hypothetical protein